MGPALRYVHTLSRGCNNALRHTAASSWRRTMALWLCYITLPRFKCGYTRYNGTIFAQKNTNLHDQTKRFHDDQAIVGNVNYLDFASLCRFNNLTCQMEPNPLAFNLHPSLKGEASITKKTDWTHFFNKGNPDSNSLGCGELHCAVLLNKKHLPKPVWGKVWKCSFFVTFLLAFLPSNFKLELWKLIETWFIVNLKYRTYRS